MTMRSLYGAKQEYEGRSLSTVCMELGLSEVNIRSEYDGDESKALEGLSTSWIEEYMNGRIIVIDCEDWTK